MSFLVCFVLLSVGFTVGFGVAWLRGLRLRMFVARLFGEIAAGRVFMVRVGGVHKRFRCVEVDGDEGSVGG